MKKVIFFLAMILVYGCNKPKTVFICGDHVCINKAEAEQYFEENLSLEVKIVDKKKSQEIDLVELNLKTDLKGKKQIKVLKKKKTKEKLKLLSKNEIKKKKAQLKKKKETKKKISKDLKVNKQVELKKNAKKQVNLLKKKEIVNKPTKEIVDVCTILEKCSIDDISKYLIKQGKEKGFPNITLRE